jgi:hypothetical protein
MWNLLIQKKKGTNVGLIPMKTFIIYPLCEKLSSQCGTNFLEGHKSAK